MSSSLPNNNNNLPLHSSPFSSLLPVGGSLVTAQTAVLGAVVQRGPHYEYGNEQDGGEGKTGTLLNIIRVDSNPNSNDQSKSDDAPKSLLGKVKWAETGVVGLYRLGPDQFDLVFAEIMIPVHLDGMPVDVSSGGAILGAAVSRNPEFWCWGDQDGTRGGHVVRVENELGFVTVKWGDESIFRYRAGGKHQQQQSLSSTSTWQENSSTLKPICDLLYGERWNKKMDSTPVYLHEKNILSGCENSNLSNFPTSAASNEEEAFSLLLENDPTSPMRKQISNDDPGVSNETQFPLLQKLSAQQIISSSSSSRALPKESDPVSIENFRPGARVIRGPSWRQSIYGDQDLECGGWGILRSCDAKEKFVRVKWANGIKRNYRAGIDQAYDLQYDANPLSPIRITTATSSSSPTNWNNNNINNNNNHLPSRRYHFSAAPSNVILAYNESRRRQLQAFVDFNIREKRKMRKEHGNGKTKNTGNVEQQLDFNIDRDDDDHDDDAFDVTSICTTMTEQGEYTELFSFCGFTVNTNRNKQNKINITANPNDDDDDDDDQTSLDTDSIFIRGNGNDIASVKLRDDDLSSVATNDDNARRNNNNHNNNANDDDDDLSSVVSNFSCFKINNNNTNDKNNNKALVNFIPKEMEVLNHTNNNNTESHHQRQEHDILTENEKRENTAVSDNSNNSATTHHHQHQQELAAPPLRPVATTSNKNNTHKNDIQISELCLKCKERARIYGNVPCGHVTLCPFCVAEELLKMEMNCKKNVTNRNGNNDKKPNQGCFCLVCNQPVEMVIKIFK